MNYTPYGTDDPNIKWAILRSKEGLCQLVKCPKCLYFVLISDMKRDESASEYEPKICTFCEVFK